MNRATESHLLDFCVRQRTAFHTVEWLHIKLLDRNEVATTALFLAGVDWYGHRQELFSVAEALHAGCTGHFARLAVATGFDCGRFSGRL